MLGDDAAKGCENLSMAKEVSLRPYSGMLFVAKSRDDYEKTHKRIFKRPDLLNCSMAGRFSGGEGRDGIWTYVVYAEGAHVLAHEMAHVVLHVFKRCGLNPFDSDGEAFCYMLSQLMLDVES